MKTITKEDNIVKEEVNFYTPFEGFYNSIYDDIINSILENEVEEGYLTEDQVDNIDYTNLYLQMSEYIFDSIIESFNDEFNLFTDNNYITFDGLYSPKYYNYSTDKIEAKISYNNYSKIYGKVIINDNFINYVNEASKSRDGFASFYEGINEVVKEPAIFLEYLFQWFCFDYYRDEIIYKTTDNLSEIIYNNI